MLDIINQISRSAKSEDLGPSEKPSKRKPVFGMGAKYLVDKSACSRFKSAMTLLNALSCPLVHQLSTANAFQLIANLLIMAVGRIFWFSVGHSALKLLPTTAWLPLKWLYIRPFGFFDFSASEIRHFCWPQKFHVKMQNDKKKQQQIMRKTCKIGVAPAKWAHTPQHTIAVPIPNSQ